MRDAGCGVNSILPFMFPSSLVLDCFSLPCWNRWVKSPCSGALLAGHNPEEENEYHLKDGVFQGFLGVRVKKFLSLECFNPIYLSRLRDGHILTNLLVGSLVGILGKCKILSLKS